MIIERNRARSWKYLALDTNVSEMRGVVEGVNDMINRLRLAEVVSTEQVRRRLDRTKKLVMLAQRKAEEIKQLSTRLDAPNSLSESIQRPLAELHKTLVWIFLKA
jgi:hypothetical protein